MITVTKQSNSVLFEFENNPHYLQQGTMEVPFNSLILVEDESDMLTFRKASTNDILFSAMFTEFSSLGNTKEDVVSALEDMMFAEGGSGGGVDPEDVVEIVESALTDYWTSAQTQSAINQASSGKQDTLISGTNIKTINNESLLGSGNITISGGGSITIDPTLDSGSTNAVANSAITNAIGAKLDASAYTPTDLSEYWTSAQTDSAITQAVSGKQDTLTAGTGIDITSNVISVTGGTSSAGVVEVTQAEYDALVSGGTVDPDALYIITDAEEINLSGYALSSAVTAEIAAAVSGKADSSAVTQSLSSKQDTLVSGTNIKTINNESLLGSGNITISGGGSSYVYYTEDTTEKIANIDIETNDGEGNTAQYWLGLGGGGNGFGAQADTDDGEGNITSSDGQINIDPIGGVTISVSNSEGGESTITDLTVESTGVSINGDKVVTEAAFDYDPITSALTITFLNA